MKSDTDDNDDETTNIFSKEKDTRGIVTPIVGSVTLSDLQEGYNNAREANPDMSSMAILKELVPQVTITKEGIECLIVSGGMYKIILWVFDFVSTHILGR